MKNKNDKIPNNSEFDIKVQESFNAEISEKVS